MERKTRTIKEIADLFGYNPRYLRTIESRFGLDKCHAQSGKGRILYNIDLVMAEMKKRNMA